LLPGCLGAWVPSRLIWECFVDGKNLTSLLPLDELARDVPVGEWLPSREKGFGQAP